MQRLVVAVDLREYSREKLILCLGSIKNNVGGVLAYKKGKARVPTKRKTSRTCVGRCEAESVNRDHWLRAWGCKMKFRLGPVLIGGE